VLKLYGNRKASGKNPCMVLVRQQYIGVFPSRSNQYIMQLRLQVVPHSVTTSVDSLRGRPSGIARLNLNLTPHRRGICHLLRRHFLCADIQERSTVHRQYFNDSLRGRCMTI